MARDKHYFFPLSPFLSLCLLRWSHNDCKYDKNSTNNITEGIVRRTCKGPVAMILHFIRRERHRACLHLGLDAFISTLHTISAGRVLSHHFHSFAIIKNANRFSLCWKTLEACRAGDDVPWGPLMSLPSVLFAPLFSSLWHANYFSIGCFFLPRDSLLGSTAFSRLVSAGPFSVLEVYLKSHYQSPLRSRVKCINHRLPYISNWQRC